MFSRQLKYSYLMYIYIKENTGRYISAEEITWNTKVPKRWGKVLLGHMSARKLIGSTKGKGYCYITRNISFWEFYILTESPIAWFNLNKTFNSEDEKRYSAIISKIESIIHQEMSNIKI